MLAGILGSIDVKERDLDQKLALTERSQKMSQNNLEFVGLIEDAITHREDIRKIEVYLIIYNKTLGLDQSGSSQRYRL